MQNSLDLKMYKVPEHFSDEAKSFIDDINEDFQDAMNRAHRDFNEQIAFLKRRYQIALKYLRPEKVSEELLRTLFDEVEMISEPETEPEVDDSREKPKAKKQRKKKRKAIADHLPRTVVDHHIPEEEKTCSKDGNKLHSIGYDVKEELKYIPAKFEVIEHRYHKYACRSCDGGIKRLPPMETIVPGSYASSELLAHIAVSKFMNHLPLYRQEKMYAREGVHISRQVMADWMIKLGENLNPLIGIMNEKILESPVVHADETPVKILTQDGVRTSKQAYMWQISSWGKCPLVLFEYDASRKKEVAKKLLGTYEGYIQIDGYGGYDVLFDETSKRVRVGCMAHVLRKFKDVVSSLPKDERANHSAHKVMAKIKELYQIEDQLRECSFEQRYEKRIELNAAEILEDIQELVAERLRSVSKNSPYFGALQYAENELEGIAKYLEHGMIELDNNHAENAIRPFAVGRRNWLFICTEKGAQASANIYSLLITAKANNIEPFTYLNKVIEELPSCKTLEDYERLLPL